MRYVIITRFYFTININDDLKIYVKRPSSITHIIYIDHRSYMPQLTHPHLLHVKYVYLTIYDNKTGTHRLMKLSLLSKLDT